MYLTIYIRKLKQSESVWMSWHHVFCVTSRLFQNFAHFAPCPRDPNKVNPETRALLQPWLGSKLRRMTRRTGHLARLWVEQSMYFFKWNHSPREFMLHIWKPEVSTTYIYRYMIIYIYMHILWDIILRWLCLKIGCPKCSWFVSVYHHFPLLDRHVLWALSRYTPQWTPQNGLAFIRYIVNISIYLMVDIPHTYMYR